MCVITLIITIITITIITIIIVTWQELLGKKPTYFSGSFRDLQLREPLMVSFPYYSQIWEWYGKLTIGGSHYWGPNPANSLTSWGLGNRSQFFWDAFYLRVVGNGISSTKSMKHTMMLDQKGSWGHTKCQLKRPPFKTLKRRLDMKKSPSREIFQTCTPTVGKNKKQPIKRQGFGGLGWLFQSLKVSTVSTTGAPSKAIIAIIDFHEDFCDAPIISQEVRVPGIFEK